MEQALSSRRTLYEVMQEGAHPLLSATSEQSGSVLWHELDIPAARLYQGPARPRRGKATSARSGRPRCSV